MGTYVIRETYEKIEQAKKNPAQEAQWKEALKSKQSVFTEQETGSSEKKENSD